MYCSGPLIGNQRAIPAEKLGISPRHLSSSASHGTADIHPQRKLFIDGLPAEELVALTLVTAKLYLILAF
jgi:hypothetical protein